MAKYEPRVLDFDVQDADAFRAYVIDELRSIAGALMEVEEVLLKELHVAPVKPRDGMVVLADGADFDPGSGAGFYGRSDGAWVFLG